jgi:hypothetical protein
VDVAVAGTIAICVDGIDALGARAGAVSGAPEAISMPKRVFAELACAGLSVDDVALGVVATG